MVLRKYKKILILEHNKKCKEFKRNIPNNNKKNMPIGNFNVLKFSTVLLLRL